MMISIGKSIHCPIENELQLNCLRKSKSMYAYNVNSRYDRFFANENAMGRD